MPSRIRARNATDPIEREMHRHLVLAEQALQKAARVCKDIEGRVAGRRAMGAYQKIQNALRSINEIGNIVINGVLGSIMNLLKENVEYSVPLFSIANTQEIFKKLDSKNKALFARTHFAINEKKIEGDILVIFKVGELEKLFIAVNKLIGK